MATVIFARFMAMKTALSEVRADWLFRIAWNIWEQETYKN